MAGRGLRRTLTISEDRSKSDSKPTDNDGLRRTVTISDQSKSIFKPTANDEDDNNDDNNNTSAVDDEFCRSIGRTGIGMPSPVRGGRTLMDIIREEQKMCRSGSGSIRNPANGTITWKSFKDRIRLRRAGTAWSEPEPGQELEIGPPSSAALPPNFVRSLTVRGPNNVSAHGPGSKEEDDDDDLPIQTRPDENLNSNSNLNLGGGGNDPGKTSLMDLFDGFGSFDSDADRDEDEEEEEEDEDADEENEELYHACCVCMVRHKGAAFIPCGHTFCRLCSRELWVSRGNCPLCNGFILEILDIF